MAILGIDEVGHGPLAGPLVVGAVILPDNAMELDWVAELRDSKKLSSKKRERLSEVILKESPATGLGWVYPAELDEVGISAALRLATSRAVKSVQSLHTPFSQIVIDGKVNFLTLTNLEKYVTTTPKADDLIKEVSAASIIAKVARDHYMVGLAKKYPGYGFERNVGYGTAAHLAAIKDKGITPEHRKSFEPIKSMLGFKPPYRKSRKSSTNTAKNIARNAAKSSPSSHGSRGEKKIAAHLERLGHEILFTNFKTKLCEIDLISVKDNQIFFTEVKTRKNSDFGGSLAAINRKKLDQMNFSVKVFQKLHPEYNHLNPLLAVGAVEGDEDLRVTDWFPLDG